MDERATRIVRLVSSQLVTVPSSGAALKVALEEGVSISPNATGVLVAITALGGAMRVAVKGALATEVFALPVKHLVANESYERHYARGAFVASAPLRLAAGGGGVTATVTIWETAEAGDLVRANA